MIKIRIKAERMLGRDLRPGDLFSTYGQGYWAYAMDQGSAGERVYIRTNSEPDEHDDADEPVYRITIERD